MLHNKEKISKKKIISLTSIILAVGTIVVFLFAFRQPGDDRRPKNGVLDLNGRVVSKSMNLTGEWDFYWDRLLSYEEITAGADKDIVADTSTFWNNYRIDGEKLPAFGYATYVLKVANAPIGELLAIKIPQISTAYDLYIDGSLLASSGTVGTDAQMHKPGIKTATVEFTVAQSDFLIIIRVSNFSAAFGGMYYALALGNPSRIGKGNLTTAVMEIFSLGGLLVVIIYYLSFIFLGKDERINRRINIVSVLLCLLLVLRVLTHSEFMINTVLPYTDYYLVTRLDYLLLFWFSICGLHLCGILYPREIHKKVRLALFAYGMIMSIIALVTPISFFMKFIGAYETIALAAGLYIVAGLSLAYLRGRKYAMILLIGAFAVMFCTLRDLAFPIVSLLGYTGELIPLSILILLLVQPFLHAVHAIDSLNKIVDTEAAFMQAQIKPHFIYNVLSAISSYCETDPQYAQRLIDDFSNYLRLSFDFKKIESSVPLDREISLVKAYAEIQKSRFPDFLSIEYEIDENIRMNVPLLSIQPLVENAIVHGVLMNDKAGYVKIKISLVEGGTIVSVSDDGAGIPYAKLKDLLSEENERGIGLFNIDKRLRKAFGKGLVIETVEGKGTTVSYTIPSERKQNDKGNHRR